VFLWGKNFLKEVLPPHPYLKNFKTKVKKDTALSKGAVSFFKVLEGGSRGGTSFKKFPPCAPPFS
jgi:hypothetical protein